MKVRCAASLSARVPKADACKDIQSSRALSTHGPLLRESDLLVFDVIEICLFSMGVPVFFYQNTRLFSRFVVHSVSTVDGTTRLGRWICHCDLNVPICPFRVFVHVRRERFACFFSSIVVTSSEAFASRPKSVIVASMSPSCASPVTGASSDSKVPSGSTTTCATLRVAARKRCTKCLCKRRFNLRPSRHSRHNCFPRKSKTSASQHEIATSDTWQLDSVTSRLLKNLATTPVCAAVHSLLHHAIAAYHPGPTHFFNLLKVWKSFVQAISKLSRSRVTH